MPLGRVIRDVRRTVGVTLARIVAAAGYEGHNTPPDERFKVYTSGQKRGVTPAIRRELGRRSAVEPVIGHLEAEHRMSRNHLARRMGDVVNPVLAAAGNDFRILLGWLRHLSCLAIGRTIAERRQPRSINLG